MEIDSAEFQYAEFRFSLARIRDRLPPAARIPIELESVAPGITFPRSRADKRVFACRPRHLRHEAKPARVLANDESAAATEQRCVQNKCAVTVRRFQ